MKVKENLCREFINQMTESEKKDYEQYLINVEGYPTPTQIEEKEYEDEMLLEQIAEYYGGYSYDYRLKN